MVVGGEGPVEPLVMLGRVGRWPGVAVLLHLRQKYLIFTFHNLWAATATLKWSVLVMKSVFIFI